jgi:hypothetical protein
VAKPVTDPALLAALEAPESAPQGKPVTDPALLAQLEGSGEAKPAAPVADDSRGTLQKIREAIHAPTRILENGLLLGLGDRARAGMGAILSGGGYGDNLKQEQAETEKYQTEHPIGATAADVVGGALAPIGAVGAATKGASLGAKTIYAALTGGGIGALQGGLGSKDWTDVAQTAKDTGIGGFVGGSIGAVLPGTGALIGKGVSTVANAIRGKADGMSRSASNHLVNALEADTPAAVRSELDRLGPDAMLADAGPAFLGKAQGASLNSDEGRTILFNALKNRDQGTNSRVMGDVERALGPAEDPQAVTNAIIAHRRTVDNVAYPAALDTAPPVRTGRIMQDLEDFIPHAVGLERRALENLREMMTRYENRARIDPFTGRQEINGRGEMVWDRVPVAQDEAHVLHKVKQELDNVIEHNAAGLGVPAAAFTREQYALTQMRHALNETLEHQVPGYAAANRRSAQLARRADAVKEGTQYLGEGKTTPSPSRFLDDFEQLEAGERIAFGKGSRGEIDRKLGTKANDLQALRRELQGEGGWNTDKIGIVHGDDAARELMQSVERNLKFRDTHTKVSENSQTEIRRAAREQMKPQAESKEKPLVGPDSSIPGMLTTTLKRYALAPAWRALTHIDPTRSYGEVAKVLTAQGPERDRHLRAIADAMSRRNINSSVAAKTGDRSALAAAVLANVLTNDRRQRPQQ